MHHNFCNIGTTGEREHKATAKLERTQRSHLCAVYRRDAPNVGTGTTVAALDGLGARPEGSRWALLVMLVRGDVWSTRAPDPQKNVARHDDH